MPVTGSSSAAVMASSWGRAKWRHGGLAPMAIPGPMNPAGSIPATLTTSDPIGLTVEIFVNNAWTDISTYVYYRDRVKITRGRPDETSRIQPQTCVLTLNNRDGRFSPRNPVGTYYGSIGRNTPLRVSRLYNGIRWFRFYGEVSAWPTQWDISGSDVYTKITASGILRRLNQGAVPIGSAMYRAYAFATSETPQLIPVAYWPCEDASSATSIASGIAGGSTMTVTGSPKFASDTSFVCSQPLPVLNGSSWSGPVSYAGTWTDNVCRLLVKTPAGASGETDDETIAQIYTTGTVARLDLRYGTAGVGSFKADGFDTHGNQLFGPLILAPPQGATGNPTRVSFALRTSGANVEYELQALVVGDFSTAYVGSGTLSSASIGAVTSVTVNPNGTSQNTVVGHISVQPVWDSLFDLVSPLNAWTGEAGSLRFARLGPEQGISAIYNTGSDLWSDNTVTLGYQLSDTFPNLLQQIADTDLGFIHEPIDQVGVEYRTRLGLYNQPARLTLDYAQNQLSASLNPTDDDLYTRNDVTVSRIGGSSARQTQTSGTLNTSTPPAGVGDYTTTYSLSVGKDTALADHAGWRLHMGTVDEPRYPQISVNLRSNEITPNQTLMNSLLTMNIGDRIAIVNPPAWMPSDPITQVLQGYSETLGNYEHDMVLTCSPEDPYHIAILDDVVLSVADTDGSTLVNPQSPTDTTILVATTNATSPLWTTNAGDFPFDISVGGERMTVTNITGSSSPQTFTVTRSVNGVVKQQTSGTDVRLWQPMILSL